MQAWKRDAGTYGIVFGRVRSCWASMHLTIVGGNRVGGDGGRSRLTGIIQDQLPLQRSSVIDVAKRLTAALFLERVAASGGIDGLWAC